MEAGRPKNLIRAKEIKELADKGLKTGQIATLLGIDRQLAEYYLRKKRNENSNSS